jgi:hypothetical protein
MAAAAAAAQDLDSVFDFTIASGANLHNIVLLFDAVI